MAWAFPCLSPAPLIAIGRFEGGGGVTIAMIQHEGLTSTKNCTKFPTDTACAGCNTGCRKLRPYSQAAGSFAHLRCTTVIRLPCPSFVLLTHRCSPASALAMAPSTPRTCLLGVQRNVLCPLPRLLQPELAHLFLRRLTAPQPCVLLRALAGVQLCLHSVKAHRAERNEMFVMVAVTAQ